MSNEIYETENGEMVADCKLCEKQILLETDEYYQVGIFHKSPMICDGSMDTKGFLHTKCYEEVAEGLIENIQLLLDQVETEGEVLGFQE